MNIKNLILSIAIYLLFYCSLFSQTISNQKYIFQNNELKIELLTKKIYYSVNDIISFRIVVTNISDKDIYLFKKPYFNFDSDNDNNWKTLYINYGNHYLGGAETWQEMNILLPSCKKKFVLNISSDSLNKIGYNDLVYVNFGIGYVPNLRTINKFQFLSSIKPKVENDSTITFSSIIVESALNRESIDAFGIHIK